MLQTSTHLTDPLLYRSENRLRAVLVEALLLVIAAPLLYFPDRVDGQFSLFCACDAAWSVPLGFLVVALVWPLRRWTTGRWGAQMPLAWALWFWFLVMLPVALWAAPPALRDQYSWPRATILVWNFSLFWSVLAHASRHRQVLGWAFAGWIGAVQAIAMLAPFGMEPRSKLPGIGPIQDAIPRPLLGLFSGAESGFSTNQVAGVLLYLLPLLIAMSVAGFMRRDSRHSWQWWLVLFCTLWMGAVMVLAQSRGGLLGLMAGVVTLALLTQRRGWTLLGGLVLVGSISLFYLPPNLLDLISDAPGVGALGGVVTVKSFRLLVWEAASFALRDFFFTGMGLGTFRVLVYLLYPLPGIPPSYDLAHAHNFFLQMGVDFGVPGLVAILLLYGAAVVQLIRLAHSGNDQPIWQGVSFIAPRTLAIGWMGCMVGQTVYSLFDAVTMGSKPNFVWWWWLALIFAAANFLLDRQRIGGLEPSSERPKGLPAPRKG
jgi:putative inorganic carbon (HCO3(-)) transporter